MYEVYIDTKIFPALIEETPSLYEAVNKFNELVASYKNDPKWRKDPAYRHLDVELSIVDKDEKRTVISHWEASKGSI